MRLWRGLAWSLTGAVACGIAGAQSPRPLPAGVSVAEQYLFTAANAERKTRGLPELGWDESLKHAAVFHAQQIAAREQMSHQFPGEPSLGARGIEAGARFSKIAENVAEAPAAATIHDLWMHSAAHRANLLDPTLDRVGIAVVSRGGELFAVEDFDRSVQTLNFDQQEQAIGKLLTAFGLDVTAGSAEARRTCAMDTGFSGGSRPAFVMRFTSTDLAALPAVLQEKLNSGRFHKAEIGACRAAQNGSFTTYRVAVMLYP
jgi:hypothetical protein